MNSMDSARRASSGKQGSPTVPRKRKNASSKASGSDTTEKREARIQLMMARLWVNPEDEKCKQKRKGELGGELSIFTGQEVTAEEWAVDEDGAEEDNEE